MHELCKFNPTFDNLLQYLMSSQIIQLDKSKADNFAIQPFDVQLTLILETLKDSAITYTYDQLSRLSEDEWIKLKSEFENLALRVYKVDNLEQLPPSLIHLIDLNSRSNVIKHEYEHMKAIPEDRRKEALIVIFFTNDESQTDTNNIHGQVIYNHKGLNAYQKAKIVTNPKSLGVQDSREADLFVSILKRQGHINQSEEIEELLFLRSYH